MLVRAAYSHPVQLPGLAPEADSACHEVLEVPAMVSVCCGVRNTNAKKNCGLGQHPPPMLHGDELASLALVPFFGFSSSSCQAHRLLDNASCGPWPRHAENNGAATRLQPKKGLAAQMLKVLQPVFSSALPPIPLKAKIRDFGCLGTVLSQGLCLGATEAGPKLPEALGRFC